MIPRRFVVPGAILLLGAVLAAVVPKHPLFNAPGGTAVLAFMGASFLAAGLLIRRRERAAAP